eukprot:TRINITY_DN2776_c0_g1_i2.p1 TRINITY_DN2776_c0_g1~~TRINITY_DN2776_c0_g1_i2.p1  ORF type:complete len:618 (+),score=129.89 TRINITY_DN2776_c0_g1_i2:52-1854(+)
MSASLEKLFAPSPSTVRGKSVLVGGDPKKKEYILYATGNSIVLRSLKDPLIASLYQEHQTETTLARFSPSGFYIASADKSGKVRIWDTVNPERILKIELPIISGPILDLNWDSESKRIIAVGDGKGSYGKVFLMDSGSSVGEISGHGKAITTADIKSSRPFRVVTGAEDLKVNWYPGPPFKYERSIKDHQRFINCIRFSPDGSKFASVGSDKKGFVYDGKDAQKLGELKDDGKGHQGSIMAVSWSDDNVRFITASADKTCKIWNSNSFECETTFTFPDDVENQQLGCLWQGNHIVSIALNGDITFLDPNNPSKPLRVQKGHNKFITALAYHGGKLISGDYEAKVLEWDLGDGTTLSFKGDKHKNQVSQIKVQGDNIVTASMDDTIKITSLKSKEWGSSIPIGSPVSGVAVGKKHSDLVIVSSIDCVAVVKGGKVASKLPVKYNATSVALSADETEVAVGGKDNKIYLYHLSGDKLNETKTLVHHRGAITRLEYSPDGKYLAVADANRELVIWAGENPKITGWVFHNAKINAISWSPDSSHIASASLDSNVIVWDVNDTNKRIDIKRAHPLGANDVVWVNDHTIASAGQDCAIKTWVLTFK